MHNVTFSTHMSSALDLTHWKP